MIASNSKATIARAMAGALLVGSGAFAQNLPTAQSIYAEMGLGWNLGNTMEATGGPTAWGNPVTTKTLIDSVKAAGFKTVRIPAAWDAYANQSTMVIDPAWIAQVKTIVDYCIADSLFVILNIHWDGGWLEENVSASAQTSVNKKQGAYWRQIATTFRDYDRHLLFASANEPAMQDAYGTAFGADRMAILNSYHQTFIDSVRATGGNNASRTLIIQGPRADIELTNQVMTSLPTDHIADRLMAEIHFYPYQFCLMTADENWGNQFYYWGAGNHSTADAAHNPTWGEETYVDSVFNLMKTRFVNNGMPVILGEFGAIKRTNLTGDALLLHLESRKAFYKYVASSAKSHGLVPVMWDPGFQGLNTMTALDRTTGSIVDLGVVNGLRSGFGMDTLNGTDISTPGTRAMKVLYSAKDSLYGQVELGVNKTDISAYDEIIVRAYVNGETTYDTAGSVGYGYVTLNMVTMSSGWTWREASLGNPTFNSWADYSIPLSTIEGTTGALVSADPTKIDFFALQVYSKGFRGTIYVDYIVFVDNEGSRDTLYTFDMGVPSTFHGNVVSVSSIDVADVPDTEWETATSRYSATTPLSLPGKVEESRILVSKGSVSATFPANEGMAVVSLRDLQGRLVAFREIQTGAGMASVTLNSEYRGVAVLQVRQGSQFVLNRTVSLQ